MRRAIPRQWGDGRRELAIFAIAYLTYFGVRAVTQGSVATAMADAHHLIRFERSLGLAHEQAIQGLVVGSALLSDLVNGVYMYGHWPVLLLSGFLLHRYRPDQYRRLRTACLISGAIGLVIFAVFPVAPPRLTDLPLVDTVTVGSPGYRLLLPRELVNEYAAMPSFHVGWNLLVGIVIFGATANPLLRGFAVLMPMAMAFSVVATANHYIVDIVAGCGIVCGSLWAADRLLRRRDAPTVDGDGRSRPDTPGRTYGSFPRGAPRRQRPGAPAARSGAGDGARRS